MAERLSVAQALARARDMLAVAGSDTAALDAEVLLAHVLGRNRAWLYTYPERILTWPQSVTYLTLVERRADQEPVAYLVGHKEFFGLDFIVTPDVLVPRPETELLVEKALHLASCRGGQITLADVGTGSGVVAVGLAVNLPHARVLAIDISPAALAVARRNVVRHHVGDRVACVQADLLIPCVATFDLVIANLPYICCGDLRPAHEEATQRTSRGLGWEPRVALDGGPDGLEVVRRLLMMVARRLHPDGVLLVEIGADQGSEVLKLARSHFPQAVAEVIKDRAGLDRFLTMSSPDDLPNALPCDRIAPR
ncbi:MAG: peptide chain release factor N(5)-glutamine methyltransferase [Ardenticatenia bacterium]|nr:peptide chain release factor N(5)-glutamine methyltransferase [Ardenticatenia bacterium]